MVSSEHLCPKCGGAMKGGYLTGYSAVQHIGSPVAQLVKWFRGAGERHPLDSSSVKLSRRQGYEVIAHRCEECGYLESYAPEA